DSTTRLIKTTHSSEDSNMKRFKGFVISLALTITALPAIAHEGHHAAPPKAVTKTITGELVDTGCYLAHSGRGEKHIACATKCIANGMPMGLLTSDGTVYLLTMDHDNADPYNDLKNMAGRMVSVTGTMVARGGLKGFEV